MKRLISLSLILCLALCCIACSGDSEDQTVFYYLRTADTIAYGTDDAIVAPVFRELSPDTSLDDIIQLYLAGPMEEYFVNSVPRGTQLLSTILREDMLVLVLSQEFSSLDGIGLTLAGACLTATCHELTGLERIQVRSGEHIYDFDLNDFIFLDNSAGE